MHLIALDLGTQTGWAVANVDSGKVVAHGSEPLKPLKRNGHTPRYQLLAELVGGLLDKYPTAAIWYEIVRRHQGTRAAHVYGGFLAMLEVICHSHSIELHPAEVSAIKKHATGRGNAKKHEMIAAAIMRGHDIDDDNEADAVALAYLALANYTHE